MIERVPSPPLNSTSSLTVLSLTVESSSTLSGAVSLGSTLSAVSGASQLAGLTASNVGVGTFSATGYATITGLITGQAGLAVSSATTLTGAVSLGGALSAVSGASSLAGLTSSATTHTSLIVNSATTLTGPVSFGGALSAVSGASILAALTSSATAVTSLTVSSAVTFSGITKVLDQGDFIIQNQADTTKQLEFNLSGQTTGKLVTISSLLTTTQIIQIPNITATDTLATLGLAQAFSAVNTFNNTTSATTSLLGAVVIGNGTAATSVAVGGGNAQIGAALTVGGATTINNTLTLGGATASPQLTIAPTGANDAIVFLNAPTGQVPRIRIGVAGAIQYNINSSGGTLNLADNVNSLTFFIYTPGVAGANFVTMPAMLDATNSTTAGFVVSGGLAVAKATNIGTTLTVGGTTALNGTVNITAGTEQLTLTATAGNFARMLFNAATGQQCGIDFDIASTAILSIYGSASVPFYFQDRANSNWTPMQYNAGAIGAGNIAFNGTLAATSSTAASVKFAGGVGINGALWVSSATLIATSTALTNNAAAQIATLTNGPTAGNPTKWIPINDNGTIRNIPCW